MEFMESKYLYFGLMLFSLSYPLAQSFEHRLQLYKNWKAIFSGTAIMMLLFVPWDIWFTDMGVWWFRDDYITGFKVFQLPIEEWLFFIIVPYACIFSYEVLNYFIKKDVFRSIAKPFFLALSPTLAVLAVVYYPNYYTSITFSLTAVACLFAGLNNPAWLGRFLMMYIVIWVPFILINGTLTGNFTANPVVNYNPAEIIGFRVTTVPIEDSIYNLLMLFIVVSVYEKLKKPIVKIGK